MKRTSKILAIGMMFALLVTSVMMSTVSVQAAEKVVLDWDFKTVDGDYVKDKSGNGNDGYIGAGVTVADGVATFAGSNNEGIELPDDIFDGADVITIEIVTTPKEFSNYTALMCVGDTNGEWVVMGVMSDGSVRYAVATNGDDGSESKGNTTSTSEGNNGSVVFQSEEAMMAGAEYTIKYVIEEGETNVYLDGELALTLDTEDKDLIGDLGGPVVLGKATKWPDPSYRGTISSLKITVEGDFPADVPATEAPVTTAPVTTAPVIEDPATEAPVTTAPVTTAPVTTAPVTTAPVTEAPATEAPAATTEADNTTPDGEFPFWIISVVVGVVAAVVAVVVFVAKKKK